MALALKRRFLQNRVLIFYSFLIFLDSSWSISHADLSNELQKLDFLPSELADVIISDIEDAANSMYREKVDAKIRAIDASGAQDKKKEQAQAQAKIKNLYDSICTFEQGASVFEGKVVNEKI